MTSLANLSPTEALIGLATVAFLLLWLVCIGQILLAGIRDWRDARAKARAPQARD